MDIIRVEREKKCSNKKIFFIFLNLRGIRTNNRSEHLASGKIIVLNYFSIFVIFFFKYLTLQLTIFARTKNIKKTIFISYNN
jgi:hypothetical protein